MRRIRGERVISISFDNSLVAISYEVDPMGKRIGKEQIKREEGYLYFVGKDGYVWAAPMKHNKGARKKKVGTEKIEKEAGFMYYLDKNGYVAQAKLKNA